jgi:Chaperone of endosialidase
MYQVLCRERENSKIIAACFSLLLIFISGLSIVAQTTEFTYQGRLSDTAAPTATYDFELRLCSSPSSCPTPLAVYSQAGVPVSNGVFTVKVNFGSSYFDGSDRYLEIAVKHPADSNYTTLSPRQKLNSAPYAIQSLKASDASNLGGVAAGQFVLTTDPRLSPNNYVLNSSSQQSGVSFNIGGTGSATVLNAATQYNIGGNRVLSVDGTSNFFAGTGTGTANTGSYNSFAGSGAGSANSSASYNSFFGALAGQSNTTGYNNSFFGVSAGRVNTIGYDNSIFGVNAGVANTTAAGNSFFGSGAGRANSTGNFNSIFGYSAGMQSTTGGSNAFFGSTAGYGNTTGGGNSFFGNFAGDTNTTGGDNTAIGSNADVGTNNLKFATAIGAGAIVNTSNTVVLGRNLDTVKIPGILSITGTFSANVLDAAVQLNIGGNRILGNAGTNNLFAGVNSGAALAGGYDNSFFGRSAGEANSDGSDNSFFGFRAGYKNTLGNSNSFFGNGAGGNNTTGSSNTFIGEGAGVDNTTGIFNTFIGTSAGANNTTGSNNTIVGRTAAVGSGNLTYATAIGGGAVVNSSNTVVLGRSSDVVQIPGIITAATQYQIGGNRILSNIGTNNLFAGVGAGAANTTGTSNSFFGSGTGLRNTTGSDNTFFGLRTGGNNLDGNFNAFYGNDSGSRNTSGSQNLFLGDYAGQNNTTGGSNIFIGYDSGNGSSGTQVSNSVTIGTGVKVSASNTIALGSTTQTTKISGNLTIDAGNTDPSQYPAAETLDTNTFGRGLGVLRLYLNQAGPIYISSHLCYQRGLSGVPGQYGVVGYCVSGFVASEHKTDIKPFSSGLDVVRRLNPVTFKWKQNGESGIGLNADDVAGIAPELVARGDKGEVSDVKEEGLNLVLINAVKEQQKQIEAQQKQIEALKKIVCAANQESEVCRPQ